MYCDLPCAKHRSEHLTWILSLDPHNNPLRDVTFSSYYSDENTGGLNNLPDMASKSGGPTLVTPHTTPTCKTNCWSNLWPQTDKPQT